MTSYPNTDQGLDQISLGWGPFGRAVRETIIQNESAEPQILRLPLVTHAKGLGESSCLSSQAFRRFNVRWGAGFRRSMCG